MKRVIRMAFLVTKVGKGKSKIYNDIKAGLFTPPVKDGPISIWPEDEVDDILDLKIAGGTEEELRALVRRLVARRARRAERVAA